MSSDNDSAEGDVELSEDENATALSEEEAEGKHGDDASEADDRFSYDRLYKRVLGTADGLAQFLQAFDPVTAATLRLDTLIPRGSDLFDVLPIGYSRIADIVAEVRTQDAASRLVVVHLEVQRSRQSTRRGSLGWRMLDYYTLLRRTLETPVLPYVVLLYRARPAQGYKTYEEKYDGRVIAALTYYQVSLPSLDPKNFAESTTPLARALSGVMKAPEDEESRQALYRQSVAGVVAGMRAGSLGEDIGAALWALIHKELPYKIEAEVERAVDWSEEDVEMVQQLNQQWIQDIEERSKALGRAQGEVLGLLRAKRSWLLRDIARRFGPLPPSLTMRIESMDDEGALDRAKESLDTATALSDLAL